MPDAAFSNVGERFDAARRVSQWKWGDLTKEVRRDARGRIVEKREDGGR